MSSSCLTPPFVRYEVYEVVFVRLSGARGPAAPLDLCEESAGAGPCTVSCPRRVLKKSSFRSVRIPVEVAWRQNSCLLCVR